MNALAASNLRDMAAAQPSTQSRWGYKRAAATVFALDEPLDRLRRPDGTLAKIPNVGPSSTRILLEVLETGESATVERTIAERGAIKDLARSRQLRANFFSRARVLEILRTPAAAGVIGLEAYRGDLQMHSTWSDGSESIAALADACERRQYRYCAVTDHSYGLPIARGVSMASLAEQHAEIDRLNRSRLSFRILKGIEANIRADGEVDMTPEERRALELVLAAPHSALRAEDDQTSRMVAAVSTPGVHVLAHPRGRMTGSRGGVQADWPTVFAAAAKHAVAIEIDGDPSRQDLDFTVAGDALAAGCLFALDSDAHSGDELRYAETAIAHARLAGIPSERVINCWDVDTLLAWAERAWDR